MRYGDCAVTLPEDEAAHVLCPAVDLRSLDDASEQTTGWTGIGGTDWYGPQT
jgi:hypothetical protein